MALRWVTQYGEKTTSSDGRLEATSSSGGCPLAVSPGLNAQYAEEDLGLGGFRLTQAQMRTLSAI